MYIYIYMYIDDNLKDEIGVLDNEGIETVMSERMGVGTADSAVTGKAQGGFGLGWAGPGQDGVGAGDSDARPARASVCGAVKGAGGRGGDSEPA
jgi:hypothetical protein